MIKRGNTFYLKGIVSASLADQINSCDVENFALYTNVDKFIDWIENPTEKYVALSSARSSTTNRGRVTSRTCGVMKSYSGLIIGGTLATREMFPWTVVVDLGYGTYVATGTLISDKHIILCASNIGYISNGTHKFEAVAFNVIQMHFGVDNRGFLNVERAFTLDGPTHISKIAVHPSNKEGFPRIADVAIIVLKKSIVQSSYVSPVCLPQSPLRVSQSEGKLAYVAGWSYDETGTNSKVKKFISVKIRSEKDCKNYYDEIKDVGSTKFFCTGGDGMKSVGARGGSLVMKENNQWFLIGLPSLFKIFNSNDSDPDLNIPALNQDVGQYYSWINGVIQS